MNDCRKALRPGRSGEFEKETAMKKKNPMPMPGKGGKKPC